METPTDRSLVLRVRHGHTDDYGELVARYQTSVFNVCYRILRNRQEAEDLAQDAFLRGYQQLDKFDVARAFGPWIRKVAANLSLNYLKKHQAIQFSLDDEHDLPSDKPSSNPAAIYEQTERSAQIQSALAALPPHYRMVIELRHFQAFNYQEIADALDLPINTAKSHLYRARKLLAENLKLEAQHAH